MSTVVVITPIIAPMIISAWPAIVAAAAGAATAMGLTARQAVKQNVAGALKNKAQESVELEVSQQDVVQNVSEQEIVLARGTIELRVKRNARGKCTVCASGAGHTKAELKQVAEEFSQKMTQCFIYNRVMTELKTQGFQVVNEEQMQDETIRIHVRRWEG